MADGDLSAGSAAGRALAAQRRIVTRACEVCGAETSGTAKRRYCSHRCQVQAWRMRQAKKDAGGSGERLG